jgi:hypothetical protein
MRCETHFWPLALVQQPHSAASRTESFRRVLLMQNGRKGCVDAAAGTRKKVVSLFGRVSAATFYESYTYKRMHAPENWTISIYSGRHVCVCCVRSQVSSAQHNDPLCETWSIQSKSIFYLCPRVTDQRVEIK